MMGASVQVSLHRQRPFASVTSLPVPSGLSFLLSTIRDIKWLDIPDTLRVLLDTSVTGEEAHSRHTRDTLADPFILVLVRNVDQIMRFQVTLEVVGD
jgi:hypothetical protein